jgi:hypothetical protein
VRASCSYEATREWISISESVVVKWEMALRKIARRATGVRANHFVCRQWDLVGVEGRSAKLAPGE